MMGRGFLYLLLKGEDYHEIIYMKIAWCRKGRILAPTP